MKRALVLSALALVLGGCAALSGGITASDPFQASAERRLSVRVENIHQDDMSVRVIGAGRRHELGRIQGRTVQQFSVPWPSHQEVRFQIEPIVGRRHTTQSVPAGPGERVYLVITQPLERSVVRR